MYKDLIFKNDSLTTPTDMYEAMDAWKKENAITDKDDFTWFYDDRETEEKDSPASIDIQVQMGRWFELYTQLHDGDNLTIYPTFVNNGSKENEQNGVVFEGLTMFVNGINGCTRVSKQSLLHVLDFITFVEDHLGGRAWIESTSYHSDVYYYVIHVIIWDDTLEPVSAQANCQPLFWKK